MGWHDRVLKVLMHKYFSIVFIIRGQTAVQVKHPSWIVGFQLSRVSDLTLFQPKDLAYLNLDIFGYKLHSPSPFCPFLFSFFLKIINKSKELLRLVWFYHIEVIGASFGLNPHCRPAFIGQIEHLMPILMNQLVKVAHKPLLIFITNMVSVSSDRFCTRTTFMSI